MSTITFPDLNDYFWEVLEALLKSEVSTNALRHHLATANIKTAEEWMAVWRKVPDGDKRQNALWISIGLLCWDVVAQDELTSEGGRWQDFISEYMWNTVRDISSFVVFRRHYYALEKLNVTQIKYEEQNSEHNDSDQEDEDIGDDLDQGHELCDFLRDFLREAYGHEVCLDIFGNRCNQECRANNRLTLPAAY